MNKSRLSPILVIMLLLVPTLNFTFSSVEFNNKGYKEIMKPFTSNSWDLTGTRIIIDNNWSATASANDWCSGNGTIDNPYIIENVTIDGGNDFALTIENSRVYFIVRNSTFVDIFSYYDNIGGIILSNVSNGQLISNNCSFNGIGIYVRGYNNTISKNYISNNNIGLSIVTSQQNSTGTFTTITENNITHNSIGIIGSSGGYGAQISSNNVSNNENYGIYLLRARKFSITENVINNNYGKGIYLYAGSLYNNISKNEITNNGDEGICLEGRFIVGQPIRDCNYNWISDNKIANNSYGINLYVTEGNQVINNFVNYNQNGGITLYYSNVASIVSNEVNNNNYFGMYLQYCNLNNINNNTISYHSIGINMSNCINNDLTVNIINENDLYGINLHYTDFTNILNNVVSNNYIGINVSNSKRNDIVANEINNNQYGIYFTDSRLNAVINNTLLHNGKCFVEEGNFDYNTFEDNICPETQDLNVGLIITITLLSVSMISLVIMFWFVKKRSVRE